MAVWNGQEPLGKPAPTLLGLSYEEKEEEVRRLRTQTSPRTAVAMARGSQECGKKELNRTQAGVRLMGEEATNDRQIQRCSMALPDIRVRHGYCQEMIGGCPTGGQSRSGASLGTCTLLTE